MKQYFIRLKQHPGLSIATFVTVLGILAGAGNKSFPEIWHGALFGFLISVIFCWTPVLISNFKK
jgi:hypothetical protein